MIVENSVTFERRGEALVGTVHVDTLDEAGARRLKEEVGAASSRQPGAAIVLDLGRVDFLASVGLGALVTLARTARMEGRRLILAGLQHNVRGVLAVTHLDQMLELRDGVADALAAL